MDPEPVDGPVTATDVAWALRDVERASVDAHQALARRLGLGVTDVAALQHLGAAEEPLGPVELGHRLGIRSASATVLVDRLERAGHVRRTPHPRDRRRVTLTSTERSTEATLAALAPLIAEIETAAAELTAAEAQAAARFLHAAAEAMRRYAAGTPRT